VLSIEKSIVLDSKAFVLQNDYIRAVIAPGTGGRIQSLIYKPTETEFAWHCPNDPGKPGEELNAGGFFDCIPTCDPCNFKGKKLPIGGEVSLMPWKIRKVERTRDHVKLSMEARCRIYPLLVRKEVSLEEKRPVLVLRYEVRNLSGESLEYHYSAHNTISVSPWFRIFLPKEVTKLKLGYTGRFGKAGDEINWPWAVDRKNGNRIDLSKVADPCEKTMENLYTSKLSQRWCAAVNQSRMEAIGFTWEGEALQYLNVCTNYGGWRDYYFIALEPVTGQPDNLEIAVNKWKKDYAVIAPRGTTTWTQKIILAHNIKTVRNIENDKFIQ
jgi:hypothetical protein